MDRWIEILMEHLQCSTCHEYNQVSSNYSFEEESEKKTQIYLQKKWNLYLKEFESYSAFILYHPILKKDIIEVFSKETIDLLDSSGNFIISLEFVNKDETNSTSIWVPSEKYYSLYERMMDTKRTYDPQIQAFLIGSYDISLS